MSLRQGREYITGGFYFHNN